jgi:hypothetical protein
MDEPFDTKVAVVLLEDLASGRRRTPQHFLSVASRAARLLLSVRLM